MNLDDFTPLINASKEVMPQIYEDGLQPTVKEIGKSLHTMAKLINVALAPVAGLVWGYDKICEHLEKSLSKKLENVPDEKIITPDPLIAGPIIEAFRFAGSKDCLRELYENLLATAMNKDTSNNVHPSFVELIKQMSPEDAKLLNSIFGKNRFQIPKLKTYARNDPSNHSIAMVLYNFVLPQSFYSEDFTYLDAECCIENLERLKIIEAYDNDISNDKILKDNMLFTYEDIKIDCPPFNAFPSSSLIIVRGTIALTNFGSKFVSSVL